LKPSRKFLSLPIVTLSEGQHIGYVKNLVVNAQTKSLAALVIDPKGFFRDQRIIPYAKVVSIGDDAITIDKGAYVEKSTSLPEILTLIKEKLTINGTRVITQSGKTLGVVEEYYVDPETGKITEIEISGGKVEGFLNGKALLSADYILTIGQDVIVTAKGCETSLVVAGKGINDTFKSILHSTSSLATGTTQAIGKYFKKDKEKDKYFVLNEDMNLAFKSEELDFEATESPTEMKENLENISGESPDTSEAGESHDEKASLPKEPLG
jgi:uncharacterized protein YrrD